MINLKSTRENDIENNNLSNLLREEFAINLKPVQQLARMNFWLRSWLYVLRQTLSKFRKKIDQPKRWLEIKLLGEENVNRCRIEAARNIFAVTKGKEWRGGGTVAVHCCLVAETKKPISRVSLGGWTSILSPSDREIPPPPFTLSLCFSVSRAPVVAIPRRLMKLSISIPRLALRSDGSIFPKSSNTVSFRIWPSLYPRIIGGYCDCWNGGWGISDW